MLTGNTWDAITMNATRKFYSEAELLAEIKTAGIRVGRDQLRDLRKAGRLPHKTIGRRVWYPTHALNQILK